MPDVLEEDHRPWGYYQLLADESGCKVKRVIVYPGQRLSLQRHIHRAEHWYILTGEAVVTIDNQDLPLQRGGSVDIPRGSLHRIRNAGAGDVVFIEVQTGEYLREDDIERIEDDYGRIP